MKRLVEEQRTFSIFSNARYATVVSSQQINRTSGHMQEGKVYFSGKHKLYGLKVDLSVLPVGRTVMCTNHYPRSVSDVTSMSLNRESHDSELVQAQMEDEIPDIGELSERFPLHWDCSGLQGIPWRS